MVRTHVATTRVTSVRFSQIRQEIYTVSALERSLFDSPIVPCSQVDLGKSGRIHKGKGVMQPTCPLKWQYIC